MTQTRPHIVCLMNSSLDGRLHPSRWTRSPDGKASDWSAVYEAAHDAEQADAWLVGRVTMAEMAKGVPHPPHNYPTPPRPVHIARREGPFGIALDRSGKLHFAKSDIGGDAIVVLLGRDVPDSHLAELVDDGVSYLVAEDAEMALAPLIATLAEQFGIATLMIEGGGHVNGAFFAAGLIDELIVILAPALDGGPSTAIVEAGDAGLRGKVTLSLRTCDQLENGALRLRYAVARDDAG
jgi:riboflavin biosynthesis pyrimidine reductase